jgi:hypothetical protein
MLEEGATSYDRPSFKALSNAGTIHEFILILYILLQFVKTYCNPPPLVILSKHVRLAEMAEASTLHVHVPSDSPMLAVTDQAKDVDISISLQVRHFILR